MRRLARGRLRRVLRAVRGRQDDPRGDQRPAARERVVGEDLARPWRGAHVGHRAVDHGVRGGGRPGRRHRQPRHYGQHDLARTSRDDQRGCDAPDDRSPPSRGPGGHASPTYRASWERAHGHAPALEAPRPAGPLAPVAGLTARARQAQPDPGGRPARAGAHPRPDRRRRPVARGAGHGALSRRAGDPDAGLAHDPAGRLPAGDGPARPRHLPGLFGGGRAQRGHPRPRRRHRQARAGPPAHRGLELLHARGHVRARDRPRDDVRDPARGVGARPGLPARADRRPARCPRSTSR